MFLGKDIMGNPVITVSDGRQIGKVKDIYLTTNCRTVAGLYLGTDGLFSRTAFLVKREDIVTIGEDAILVKNDDVIYEAEDIPEIGENWLRRDELQGRPVDTPGGTKVGRIGDVMINHDGDVQGFSLSYTYVDGPVSENNSVAIHTLVDTGHRDGRMTVNLEKAEKQDLSLA